MNVLKAFQALKINLKPGKVCSGDIRADLGVGEVVTTVHHYKSDWKNHVSSCFRYNIDKNYDVCSMWSNYDMPVSYTHLDVYKRQTTGCTLIRLYIILFLSVIYFLEYL